MAAPLFWGLWWLTHQSGIDWLRPLNVPIDFLRIAVLYPVFEEIVFRGALQGSIYRRPWGKRRRVGISMANLLTSFLFAALHVALRPSLMAAAVFVPSLVFGHFRERYDSLGPPILLHMYYNLGTFWLL